MFHERVLPTLDSNIKDGNSLIDTDFYSNQLDFGEEKKIKPFNWKNNFPVVFKEQGFDCVIGNPPYLGGREWKEENGNVYDYFMSKYKVAEYQFDIYALFWEAGIKLLKPNGEIGFITPNTWLNNQSNKKLRQFILNNTNVSKIVDYSKIKVFDQATVLPIITILENKTNKKSKTEIFEPTGNGYVLTQSVNQEIWNDGDLSIFNINLSQSDLTLRHKIEENTEPLEKLALVKGEFSFMKQARNSKAKKPVMQKRKFMNLQKN
ncbi:MAG: Eco57I restriction-modification methylase domain-containing protein [Bacteroidetes bacterium]|nr:Eco57I restriction-modification methylase domain-containing protein [Bacteroidota bacterium]